jgi:hypothetical protein
MTDDRNESLLAWQWRLYKGNHTDRTNLTIHLLTQPLFVAGLIAAITGPLTGVWWLLAAGPAAMLLAIVLQGRGHKIEEVPPVPFRGPGDVVGRLLAEQLITFPRYVLSGELAKAWRRVTPPPTTN